MNWRVVGSWLQLPNSKLEMIRFSTESQCREACWKLFLEEHPCPSWRLIGWSLIYCGYHKELQEIQKYLRGIASTVTTILPWLMFACQKPKASTSNYIDLNRYRHRHARYKFKLISHAVYYSYSKLLLACLVQLMKRAMQAVMFPRPHLVQCWKQDNQVVRTFIFFLYHDWLHACVCFREL